MSKKIKLCFGLNDVTDYFNEIPIFPVLDVPAFDYTDKLKLDEITLTYTHLNNIKH
jgi:hypothetical protein